MVIGRTLKSKRVKNDDIIKISYICKINVQELTKKYWFNNHRPFLNSLHYLERVLKFKDLEEKRCSKCNESKSLSEFSKDKKSKDGLAYQCKECRNCHKKKYNQTEDGLLINMYNSQKGHSKKRGHKLPNYTKYELGIWCKSQKLWSKLLCDWVNSGYKTELIPSIDRLDDYKPYTLDNIQLMTWAENKAKGHKDRKEGRNNKQSKAVLQYTLNGEIIKEHYSIAHAVKNTGIHKGNIWSCCKGSRYRKTAGGYKWAYKK